MRVQSRIYKEEKDATAREIKKGYYYGFEKDMQGYLHNRLNKVLKKGNLLHEIKDNTTRRNFEGPCFCSYSVLLH